MLQRRTSTDIREIAVEAAPVAVSARAMYEQLLRSPFYDPEKGRWIGRPDESQDAKPAAITTAALLEVVVTARLATGKAEELWTHARETQYLERGKLWRGQTEPGGVRKTEISLLAVWALAQIDTQEARTELDVLKAGEAYYEPGRSWQRRILPLGSAGPVNTTDQLLALLACADLGGADTREEFRRWHAAAYDEERGLWRKRVDRSGADTLISTWTQLVGLLVEARFHPAAARAHLKALKEDPLFYDADQRLWRKTASVGNGPRSGGATAGQPVDRYTSADQLLGILIEQTLETSPQEAAREIPELLSIS